MAVMRSPDSSMPKPSYFHLTALFFFGMTAVAGWGCAVDSSGLPNTIRDAGGGGSTTPIAGTGGGFGAGGTTITGTGGILRSGGAPGGGGTIGSGGGGGGTLASGGMVGGGGTAGRSAGSGGRANGGCGPTNCPNGCCTGSTCIMNRGDLRCGTAGAVCAPCNACFRCSGAGACEPDPGSLWSVICASATIEATKPGNLAWDGLGVGMASPPDPFCQLTVNGDALARTMTMLNTFSPAWNQSITPGNTDLRQDELVAQGTPWTVAVVDDDGNALANEPICSVAPRLTDADFVKGTVTFPATQSCTSLTIQLVCAE
jgi:hypothetical protein